MKNYNITVILPVINETSSLIETIKLIDENNFKNKIVKILIVMSEKKTSQNSKKICINFSKKFNILINR